MRIDRNSYNLLKIKNRHRIVNAFKKSLVKNPAYPVELILEITNQCNLSCVMCPRANMDRPLGQMDISMFKDIINQVKTYIELVYLSGGVGEPTIHPDLFKMLEYCRASNVRVGVSTNATLLDDRMSKCLLENSPDLILLSLDGATKLTHEKIRVGSKFEKTMDNVENFLKLKALKNTKLPYTIVQMVYMPENQFEADLFKKKWKRFKSVNDIRLKKFLHLQGANYYPKTDVHTQAPQSSCILPWMQLSISWDGKLALCCRDYGFKEILGSLKNFSILNLWNSEEMIRYRTLIGSSDKKCINLCRNCTGISPGFAEMAASVFFDDLTVRKLLPIAEKLAIRTGFKIADYK